jgi:hypothetical protein
MCYNILLLLPPIYLYSHDIYNLLMTIVNYQRNTMYALTNEKHDNACI